MGAAQSEFYGKLLARWGRRRLAAKLATVVLVATVLIVPAIFATIWASSRSTFLDIEGRTLEAQTARAQNALKMFEETLSKSLGDYAYWDDSRAYLNAPTKAFEQSALNPFTFKNMGVDVITYVRFDGTVVFNRVVNPDNEAILVTESDLFGKITSKGRFFEAAKAKKKHVAYVRTPRGLYLLYAEWQSDSVGKAKPSGLVVMGNLIKPAMLSAALQADVRLNLDLASPTARTLASSGRDHIFVRHSKETISKVGLHGQDGELVGIVEFSTPRHLILAGRSALLSMAGAIVGGILLLVLTLWVGVRMIVVRRLKAIQRFVENYQSNPDIPQQLEQGDDEIARLSQAFKDLSDDLGAAQQQLSQKAYVQGKADSAAGMLHNVRNALAPIRVMQDKWLREEALPFRQNMVRAATELARDDIDPDRKAALETFMISAARQIALGASGRLLEMEENKQSIDQISAILGGYDFNTSGRTAGDEVDLLKLIRAEIKILNGRDGDNVLFELPASLPGLTGNPLHLSQVIGNILVNADEAMIAAGVPEKRMVVRYAPLDDGLVEIRFTDNGDGIAPENIPDTFKREYSTRNHKAGGIGLHWSANAMRAMGGSISLESEGVSKGATAVLTLRLADSGTEELKAAA